MTLVPGVQVNDQSIVTADAGASEELKTDLNKVFEDVKSDAEIHNGRKTNRGTAANERPGSRGSIVKANLSLRLEAMSESRKRPRPETRPPLKTNIQGKSFVRNGSDLELGPKSNSDKASETFGNLDTKEDLELFLESSTNEEFEAFLKSRTDEELETFLKLATEEEPNPFPASGRDEELEAFLHSDGEEEFEAILIPGHDGDPGAIIILAPELEPEPLPHTHSERGGAGVKLESNQSSNAPFSEDDLPDMIINGASITFTRPFRDPR